MNIVSNTVRDPHMTTVHYYAQTFPPDQFTQLPSASSLDALLNDPTLSTDDRIVLYLSSLHFGVDPDTQNPYLHLNDNDVGVLEPFFEDVYNRCQKASCVVEIRVMLGGAGGAYAVLFSHFELYYLLLKRFLQNHSFIAGIDLDVEEQLDTDQHLALGKIQHLIQQLHNDFAHMPSFALTLAPVAFSLTDNSVGMGGFVYKDLESSSHGKYITYYNVQAYGSYDSNTFKCIVDNGFSPKKLVYGMLGDEFENTTAFGTAMTELQTIATTYPQNAGVILWEYGDTKVDGVVWGQEVRRALSSRIPLPYTGQLHKLLNEKQIFSTVACTLM